MIQILKLESYEDYERCVDLQKEVWGFADRDALPSRTMLIAQRFGGSVLGAFDDEKLVGFVIALASFYAGSYAQHSHMLAVLPSYQNLGIGWQLKLAQRKEALGRNIKLITWTFDPLEARNAHLNLNKLGIITRTYHENFYPRNSSDIYSSLGTDRFLSEWWISSRRVRALLDNPLREGRTQHQDLPEKAHPMADEGNLPEISSITAVSFSPEGYPISSTPNLKLSARRLILEIPAEIKKLKSEVPDLAKDWREKTRAALTHYLAHGYVVTNLLVRKSESSHPDKRTYYLLEQADLQFLQS